MSDRRRSTGVSLGTVILVVFVILKLTNNVSWSWFWVLSPLWISCGLFMVVLAVCAVAEVIGHRRAQRDWWERNSKP